MKLSTQEHEKALEIAMFITQPTCFPSYQTYFLAKAVICLHELLKKNNIKVINYE